ncbi:hypothetical protein Ancab_017083 [Ancistrocladus abbreviatus]
MISKFKFRGPVQLPSKLCKEEAFNILIEEEVSAPERSGDLSQRRRSGALGSSSSFEASISVVPESMVKDTAGGKQLAGGVGIEKVGSSCSPPLGNHTIDLACDDGRARTDSYMTERMETTHGGQGLVLATREGEKRANSAADVDKRDRVLPFLNHSSAFRSVFILRSDSSIFDPGLAAHAHTPDSLGVRLVIGPTCGDLRAAQQAELRPASPVAYADFFSLHVPLMPATSKMLNDGTFARMKKGVQIVNVALGGLIDEVGSGSWHCCSGGVAVEIAEDVVGALIGELAATALNALMIPAEVLNELKPFVELAEKLGKLAVQLVAGESRVKSVKVTYASAIAPNDLDTVAIFSFADLLTLSYFLLLC